MLHLFYFKNARCTTCTVYIVPTMLTELLYTLQCGDTPLHLSAKGSHTTCVEYLLSAPGIDVTIEDRVSWSDPLNEIHV